MVYIVPVVHVLMTPIPVLQVPVFHLLVIQVSVTHVPVFPLPITPVFFQFPVMLATIIHILVIQALIIPSPVVIINCTVSRIQVSFQNKVAIHLRIPRAPVLMRGLHASLIQEKRYHWSPQAPRVLLKMFPNYWNQPLLRKDIFLPYILRQWCLLLRWTSSRLN